MRLNTRVDRLERLHPATPPRRAVPAGSFAEFVRGFLAGEFTDQDIDPTDYTHTTYAGRLAALLVVASPEHRAFCAANPWATPPEEVWERVLRDGNDDPGLDPPPCPPPGDPGERV